MEIPRPDKSCVREDAAGYEPPKVEMVLTAADLEREMLYGQAYVD